MDLPATSKNDISVLDCQIEQQGISNIEADVNPHCRSVVTAMDQSFEVPKNAKCSSFVNSASGRDIEVAEN